MKHLRYLSYVLRHKWYVFIECCRLGIPWQGIIHDWSKFTPAEWFSYVERFYGKGKGIKTGRDKTGYYKPYNTGDTSFDLAWLHHQHYNPHHWQWWIVIPDKGEDEIHPSGYEMPMKYRKEMLADWRGAGKAQGTPDVLAWYKSNRHRITLGPNTQEWIEQQLGVNQ